MVDRVLVKRDTDNEILWGKLVLSWATGKSQIANVSDADVPRPNTIADLKAQCARVGVEIMVPDEVTALMVVQSSGEALVLRLPGKDMIEGAIAHVQGPNYKLPQFYQHFCGPLNVAPNDRLDLLACRIGDYSIAHCG